MEKTLTPSKNRILSIDLLRGLVMIIMALDHVRDYFHAEAYLFNPLDLEKTNGLLFFTRWITNYCAPVFVFLAGTSAFISGKKKTKKELSAFLLKRGIWLILLELTIVNFGWNFDISFTSIYFVTIWALGVSMIALSALVYLPLKWILVIGGVIVGGHNLLDNVEVTGNSIGAFFWALVHRQQLFLWAGKNFLVGYPALSWIGLMALGYCFGYLYTPEFGAEKRKKWLLLIGSGAVLLFVLLRLFNVYGDPSPWAKQPDSFFSFLSFLKTTKYPSSLLYQLMTIGPSILFLAFTERSNNFISKFVSIYGRVPMFFYIIHIYLIHLAALFAAEYFSPFGWQLWILKEPLWITETLKGYGFGLDVVYWVWLAVVLVLFPLCKWYDRYKTAHKEKWWLSYL
jgi:uncharacterized membrane protein